MKSIRLTRFIQCDISETLEGIDYRTIAGNHWHTKRFAQSLTRLKCTKVRARKEDSVERLSRQPFTCESHDFCGRRFSKRDGVFDPHAVSAENLATLAARLQAEPLALVPFMTQGALVHGFSDSESARLAEVLQLGNRRRMAASPPQSWSNLPGVR